MLLDQPALQQIRWKSRWCNQSAIWFLCASHIKNKQGSDPIATTLFDHILWTSPIMVQAVQEGSTFVWETLIGILLLSPRAGFPSCPARISCLPSHFFKVMAVPGISLQQMTPRQEEGNRSGGGHAVINNAILSKHLQYKKIWLYACIEGKAINCFTDVKVAERDPKDGAEAEPINHKPCRDRKGYRTWSSSSKASLMLCVGSSEFIVFENSWLKHTSKLYSGSFWTMITLKLYA